jgi:hypothetical protein
MMTPCTQKINAAKQKHFTKLVAFIFLQESLTYHPNRGAAKPMPQLFAQADSPSSDKKADPTMDDDENPF